MKSTVTSNTAWWSQTTSNWNESETTKQIWQRKWTPLFWRVSGMWNSWAVTMRWWKSTSFLWKRKSTPKQRNCRQRKRPFAWLSRNWRTSERRRNCYHRLWQRNVRGTVNSKKSSKTLSQNLRNRFHSKSTFVLTKVAVRRVKAKGSGIRGQSQRVPTRGGETQETHGQWAGEHQGHHQGEGGVNQKTDAREITRNRKVTKK